MYYNLLYIEPFSPLDILLALYSRFPPDNSYVLLTAWPVELFSHHVTAQSQFQQLTALILNATGHSF